MIIVLKLFILITSCTVKNANLMLLPLKNVPKIPPINPLSASPQQRKKLSFQTEIPVNVLDTLKTTPMETSTVKNANKDILP